MIVSIHQPAYLPWLGYFHRIAAADVHVVLDHVQFEKNSYINRNRILTPEGPRWLTVPLLTKGRFGQLPIAQVEIDATQNWRRKHLESLRHAYGKAPHFTRYFERLAERTAVPRARLGDMLHDGLDWFLEELSIRTTIVYSSNLSCQATKSELVEEICFQLGATTYLSGPLGKDYLDIEHFSKKGIRVVFHDYEHPSYPQQGKPFVPFLSVIDLLFNCGPGSRVVLEAGQRNVYQSWS